MSTLPSNRTLFANGVSTCKAILLSNYGIVTQAGAKVLRFTQEPTQLNVSNFLNYRLLGHHLCRLSGQADGQQSAAAQWHGRRYAACRSRPELTARLAAKPTSRWAFSCMASVSSGH